MVSVADAAPLATIPEVAMPTPDTANATVPPFTVPAVLVTDALSVTVWADGLNVADAEAAVVVVVSGGEMTSDLLPSLLPLNVPLPE
jgi:hypothetical protein